MSYNFSRQPVDVPFVQTRHRQIKTAIPAPGTEELLQELEACESRSMQGQMPIVWDRAQDFNVYVRLILQRKYRKKQETQRK